MRVFNIIIGALTVGLAKADMHGDKVVVGQTFLAGSQDPTSGSIPWALVSHGIAEKLFTVNKKDEIVPQIAESVEKVYDDVWVVTLKSGYKFSDGEAVNSQHVADALQELNDKNDSAKSSLGEITVLPEGDMKVRIESERATHMMNAVLAEWVFVIYKKDSSGNFIYTGPYVVDHFAEDHIDLSPNPYYDEDSTKRPEIELKKFADGHFLADGVKNKEVDIGFHLPIDTLTDLRKEDGVTVKSFEVGYHYMMFHNMDSLEDVRVRQAIDLAIDRIVLSQALAGGTATRSLFPDYSPYFSDGSDNHADMEAAGAKLDEAGWILNSSGKREKDGEELTVHLVAYPHRPGLVIMQPVIADALMDLGLNVQSTLTGMDWEETANIINMRTFDLLLWAQHTLPAGDPLWFLSSFFRSDGGNNHANMDSATVDSMIHTLSLAEEADERQMLAKSSQELILSDVPVSNLVTPFWHVGLSERMSGYEPWGADYYVIRADLFIGSETHESDDHGIHDHSDDHSDDSGAFSLGGSSLIISFAVLLSALLS